MSFICRFKMRKQYHFPCINTFMCSHRTVQNTPNSREYCLRRRVRRTDLDKGTNRTSTQPSKSCFQNKQLKSQFGKTLIFAYSRYQVRVLIILLFLFFLGLKTVYFLSTCISFEFPHSLGESYIIKG